MARVLIVDDEPRFRTYLDRALAREGHEVHVAANASDALDRVSTSFAPEVLVVDWMLSEGSDGLELARRLRQSFPGLATVVITGYPADQLRSQLAAGEVEELLEKPFTPEALVEAVERVSRPS